MAYKTKLNSLNYDVYPLVFEVNKPVEISIRRIGGDDEEFLPDTEYNLMITGVDGGYKFDFPETAYCIEKRIKTDSDGNFKFTHSFPDEQEYYLIFSNDDGKKINTFNVYSIKEDLVGRYPLIGDLHMHTYRSDGSESPAVVCANYHRNGYDFMVVSDHCRYYPSLEAIDAYKDVPVELNIVPGEEVHLPKVHGKTNDIHIVNFGGEYSINAMIEGAATEERGKDLKFRAVRTENVPEVMTVSEYEEKMQGIADSMEIPEGVEKIPYAVCSWIFDEIRKANGLGIFAHPNWKKGTASQVPERFCDYMFEKHPFDAFEVLGGELYFEHNGFQTIKYYEQKAKGNVFPIVGSTDSHSSYYTNPKAFICSTMVFAHENERKDIISSIKDLYSVAIDTISEEYRLVGDFRLVKYARFVVDYYLPLHNDVCFESGRLMKQYSTGTPEEKEEAAIVLKTIYGRLDRHRKKYFKF
ncbi:MAG: hypothetical protein KBT46_01845 [Ruminococcus sp.]|nr:hypothetical protein [Candidatus Copronaster equi]